MLSLRLIPAFAAIAYGYKYVLGTEFTQTVLVGSGQIEDSATTGVCFLNGCDDCGTNGNTNADITTPTTWNMDSCGDSGCFTYDSAGMSQSDIAGAAAGASCGTITIASTALGDTVGQVMNCIKQESTSNCGGVSAGGALYVTEYVACDATL